MARGCVGRCRRAARRLSNTSRLRFHQLLPAPSRTGADSRSAHRAGGAAALRQGVIQFRHTVGGGSVAANARMLADHAFPRLRRLASALHAGRDPNAAAAAVTKSAAPFADRVVLNHGSWSPSARKGSRLRRVRTQADSRSRLRRDGSRRSGGSGSEKEVAFSALGHCRSGGSGGWGWSRWVGGYVRNQTFDVSSSCTFEGFVSS